ncbi:MAG: tetratricopeptide repeat protein [Chitinophagaceae bacterium]|nr:tetratricopeptide repeat protein [Chitinophagaceae bacterium]
MKKKILVLLILLLSFKNIYPQDYKKIQLAEEYHKKDDFKKAIDIYKELAINDKNIPFIHENYMDIMIQKALYKDAIQYIQKQIKKNPILYNYRVEEITIYIKQENDNKANIKFEELIEKVKNDENTVKTVGKYLINKGLREYAEKLYLTAREASKKKDSYSLELANIWSILKKIEPMLNEYIFFLEQYPEQIEYVENNLQNMLTEEEHRQQFQMLLLERIQKNPQIKVFSELLIWLYIQEKKYEDAFIQVKSLDRREKNGGTRAFHIAQITFENKKYQETIHIAEWICNNFKNGVHSIPAKHLIIKSKELLVKEKYPISKDSITMVIQEYDSLLKEVKNIALTHEIKREKALLYAFYLDELLTAKKIIEDIIQNGNRDKKNYAYCKMDLGDIFILLNEPWEASLLYSQVEKENKETPIGYEAKLKNAKLHYYQGNFELAEAHLNILKAATSREISNDALFLASMIHNNTVSDTSEKPVKKFAEIELLLFQNKKKQAKEKLELLLKEYPYHEIRDEVWFQLAKIEIEFQNYMKAIEYYDLIIENFADDILSDDALFLKSKILEEYIQDQENAKKYYTELIHKYPGSMYVTEARKRYRILRGDIQK